MEEAPSNPHAPMGPGGGDRLGVEELFGLVYDELRELARRQLQSQGKVNTLATTALVHECYLRLADAGEPRLRERGQFFALASKAMRYLIIDHARARKAQKRGGGKVMVTLAEHSGSVSERTVDLLHLNDALERLGRFDERLVHLVECRFFGGMTAEETAQALELSPRTVERDWQRARTYLIEMLEGAA